MKDFKRCSNGHFFKKDLSECPHCPKGGTNNQSEGNGNLDKTQVFSGKPQQVNDQNSGQESTIANPNPNGGGFSEKTEVFGGNSGTVQIGGTKGRDLDKTFIGETNVKDISSGVTVPKARATRKMTGWLVSFTLDDMGIDYRLFEGNNSIGRSNENTIKVFDDPTISSKHANILFKKGDFWIKDEMAANGTFINGEEIEIGKPLNLTDGDEIKLGDTVFIFKTWY